jgi:hypothetical protein
MLILNLYHFFFHRYNQTHSNATKFSSRLIWKSQTTKFYYSQSINITTKRFTPKMWDEKNERREERIVRKIEREFRAFCIGVKSCMRCLFELLDVERYIKHATWAKKNQLLISACSAQNVQFGNELFQQFFKFIDFIFKPIYFHFLIIAWDKNFKLDFYFILLILKPEFLLIIREYRVER